MPKQKLLLGRAMINTFCSATAKAGRRIHQDGIAHPRAAVFTAKSQAVRVQSLKLMAQGPTKKTHKGLGNQQEAWKKALFAKTEHLVSGSVQVGE